MPEGEQQDFGDAVISPSPKAGLRADQRQRAKMKLRRKIMAAKRADAKPPKPRKQKGPPLQVRLFNGELGVRVSVDGKRPTILLHTKNWAEANRRRDIVVQKLRRGVSVATIRRAIAAKNESALVAELRRVIASRVKPREITIGQLANAYCRFVRPAYAEPLTEGTRADHLNALQALVKAAAIEVLKLNLPPGFKWPPDLIAALPISWINVSAINISRRKSIQGRPGSQRCSRAATHRHNMASLRGMLQADFLHFLECECGLRLPPQTLAVKHVALGRRSGQAYQAISVGDVRKLCRVIRAAAKCGRPAASPMLLALFGLLKPCEMHTATNGDLVASGPKHLLQPRALAGDDEHAPVREVILSRRVHGWLRHHSFLSRDSKPISRRIAIKAANAVLRALNIRGWEKPLVQLRLLGVTYSIAKHGEMAAIVGGGYKSPAHFGLFFHGVQLGAAASRLLKQLETTLSASPVNQ